MSARRHCRRRAVLRVQHLRPERGWNSRRGSRSSRRGRQTAWLRSPSSYCVTDPANEASYSPRHAPAPPRHYLRRLARRERAFPQEQDFAVAHERSAAEKEDRPASTSTACVPRKGPWSTAPRPSSAGLLRGGCCHTRASRTAMTFEKAIRASSARFGRRAVSCPALDTAVGRWRRSTRSHFRRGSGGEARCHS